MSTLDVEKLLKALENEDNEELLNIDFKTLHAQKKKIIKKLQLPSTEYNSMLKKLQVYRFIDELPDMRYGSYIRWISLKDPDNLKLTNGGIVCEMKVGDDGIIIVCKNRMNRFFSFKMNETLIFQRLTEQEQVLLSALDYLNS